MFRIISKNRKYIFGTLAIIAVAAGTSVAMAAIPDAEGKINACYNNNTKVLRVTENAGDCGAQSTPISWDQEAKGGAIAYGRITWALDSGNHTATLDSDNSEGIVSVAPSNYFAVCVELEEGFSAKNVSANAVNTNEVVLVAIKGLDSTFSSACSSQYDIAVYHPGGIIIGSTDTYYLRVY